MAKKTAEETPAPSEPKVKKSEAVRAAIAAGADKPLDGAEWIKAKYGLEITPSVFSQYKTAEKKKGESGAVRVGKPSTNGHTDVLAIAEQVKALIDAHGHETVVRCVELFAK